MAATTTTKAGRPAGPPPGTPTTKDTYVPPTYLATEGAVILHKDSRPVIESSEDIYKVVQEIAAEDQEHLVLVAMNAAGRMVAKQTVSIGTITGTIAQPREVYRAAMLLDAHHIAIAHNHPSGNLEPSPEDVGVTYRMLVAGRIIGIDLVDHIIVSEQGYRSIMDFMREQGGIPDGLPPGMGGQQGGQPGGQQGGAQGSGSQPGMGQQSGTGQQSAPSAPGAETITTGAKGNPATPPPAPAVTVEGAEKPAPAEIDPDGPEIEKDDPTGLVDTYVDPGAVIKRLQQILRKD